MPSHLWLSTFLLTFRRKLINFKNNALSSSCLSSSSPHAFTSCPSPMHVSTTATTKYMKPKFLLNKNTTNSSSTKSTLTVLTLLLLRNKYKRLLSLLQSKYIICVLLIYIAYYCWHCIHRPRLTFSKKSEINRYILSKCHRLQSTYYPFFLFGTYCQLVLFIICGKLTPWLFCRGIKYERTYFSHSDGQKIPLDWVFPTTAPTTKPTKKMQSQSKYEGIGHGDGGGVDTPVIIFCYGIAGDQHGYNVRRMIKLCTLKRKWISVVLHRRGHDRDTPLIHPKLTIFGACEDMHLGMLDIHRRYPRNPKVLFGFSAGTQYLARYIGDLGLCLAPKISEINKKTQVLSNINISDNKMAANASKFDWDAINTVANTNDGSSHDNNNARTNDNGDLQMDVEDAMAQQAFVIKQYSNAQEIHDSILCAVAICPGYNISHALTKPNWLMQKLLLYLVKELFVDRHRHLFDKFNAQTMLDCQRCDSAHDLLRTYSGSVLGYSSFESYLFEANPTTNARFIRVPSLVINSNDDLICVQSNTDENRWLFASDEWALNLMLCETKYGGHCGFFDLFGNTWFDEIAVEYIQAMLDFQNENSG